MHSTQSDPQAIPGKLTITQAAETMQVSPQFLRLGLQHNKFPFGTAVKGEKRWSYYISRDRFLRYIQGEDLRWQPGMPTTDSLSTTQREVPTG